MNHCKVPLNKMKQFLRENTYIGSNIPNIIIYNVYPRFKLSLGVIIIHLLPNLCNYSKIKTKFKLQFYLDPAIRHTKFFQCYYLIFLSLRLSSINIQQGLP